MSNAASGQSSPQLARRLGTADAVFIGPAAKAAGTGLLIGLQIAAMIAYCNAAASAQLAAAYPTSGGTYIYGRERLGEWWGFAAGWGFVVGKTASCAAMALTFAAYAVPGPGWRQRLVAIAGVVGLAALNYRGVTKTAALTRILVTATLIALATAVTGIAVGGTAQLSNLGGIPQVSAGGLYGILQSAGLLFFAFAGCARIATMGEEVRNPAHTIPRAIPIALAITVVVYATVGVTVLMAAGPSRLAAAAAPLSEAVQAAGVGALTPVVQVGGAVASLGSAGTDRRDRADKLGDGPPPRPARMVGLGPPSLQGAASRRARTGRHGQRRAACCRPAWGDRLRLIRGADLYGIANASAFTQPAQDRRWPRPLYILGASGCAILVATLPLTSVAAGLVMFALGLTGRWLILHRRTRTVSHLDPDQSRRSHKPPP